MAEDNRDYVTKRVKSALFQAGIKGNYRIETYRAPVKKEIYYSIVFEKGAVDLVAESRVAQFAANTLEMSLEGFSGNRRVKDKFSFPL